MSDELSFKEKIAIFDISLLRFEDVSTSYVDTYVYLAEKAFEIQSNVSIKVNFGKTLMDSIIEYSIKRREKKQGKK